MPEGTDRLEYMIVILLPVYASIVGFFLGLDYHRFF